MDKNNQIIEAEFTEISDEHNALCEVTAEIRSITASLLWNFIELGKRFEKAKALVKHGKWGEYCEQCTGYKQRMAENYIKLYHEYGSEQFSLFGDFSNSQSIANLGATKLIELTAIPADEREQFVEDNNIDENTTVKELRALIEQQKKDISSLESEKRQKEYELAGEIDKLEEQAEESEAEIKRLTAELEEMKNRPPVDAPNSDVAALIEEAEENVRAETQKTIDDLRADVEKKQKEIDKKQKQLDKLKNNDLAAENTKLKESVSEAEKKNADLAAEIEKLKKEAALGSDKKLVALDLCFKTVQDDMRRLADALNDCKETDNYSKLSTAIVDTLDGLIKAIKDGEQP